MAIYPDLQRAFSTNLRTLNCVTSARGIPPSKYAEWSKHLFRTTDAHPSTQSLSFEDHEGSEGWVSTPWPHNQATAW